MGTCLCKKRAVYDSDIDSTSGNLSMVLPSCSDVKTNAVMESPLVDQLILEMLRIIGCFSETEDDSPIPLVKLQYIADKEQGWIQVVMSLITSIPLEEPLGPTAITSIFDDIPLPRKETVVELVGTYNLCRERALAGMNNPTNIRFERNLCVILGCIAEKFAGASSIAVLTERTLDYLITFLVEQCEPNLVLYALIAIEKFARTSENKWTINKYFANQPHNPILPLEKVPQIDSVWRQVAFCARWTLDNIFVVEGREYGYETQDTTQINAMLNHREVSEYLKVSPDGLEARCDSHSFESVRCTFETDHGCWYYEAEIITPGVMQIGWATKNSVFQVYDGYGVGDDSFSLSYDGCRRLIWHKAHPILLFNIPQWKPGDILGCLIDVSRQEVIFSLNGYRLPVCSEIFANTRILITQSGNCSETYHAAASFMAHQQCRFNFGNEEFKYAPDDRVFQTFNDHGVLEIEDKKVIPRRVYMQLLKNAPIVEGCCIVCYDKVANCSLEPCMHSGFCSECASQVTECPVCREEIWNLRVTGA